MYITAIINLASDVFCFQVQNIHAYNDWLIYAAEFIYADYIFIFLRLVPIQRVKCNDYPTQVQDTTSSFIVKDSNFK